MTTSHVQERLQAICDLGGLDPALVQRFGAFLESAPDEQLYRMGPLRWAAEHALREQEAIELFLYAAHAGLLELSWGVLCPSCAGFITSADGLRSLGLKKRCSLCEVDVDGILDDNVEVCFTVAPRVRTLRFARPEAMRPGDEFLTYFSPSVRLVGITPQELGARVRSRHRIDPGASERLDADLGAGRLFFMAPVQHAVAHVNVRTGASSREAQIDLLAGEMVPTSVSLAPGRASLRVTNRTREAAVVLFVDGMTPAPEDRAGLPAPPRPAMHPYLSGKRLLTTQVFRDLFRAESVPGEAGVSLKSLSLLFTDLKGSTEMYERIGDLRAFELVRRHFELLRGLVRSRGGAVVKTIGDAVMASFPEPARALDAAAAMLRDIRSIGDLELKVGIHTGPCIAVQSNEQLDYFGQTVNIAARVQGLARAGEIVCTTPVLEAAGAEATLRERALRAESDSAMLKGVEGAVAVHRLR